MVGLQIPEESSEEATGEGETSLVMGTPST